MQKNDLGKIHFRSAEIRVQIVVGLLILESPFFFLGGPGYHDPRWLKALWNLGHILFFALTAWLLCRSFRSRFPALPVPLLQLLVFLTVLCLGTAVEGLQMLDDGRKPDLYDIMRNQLGCLITLVFVCSTKKSRGKSLLCCRIVVVLSILSSLYPLGRAVLDEQTALYQFPVLSDFETRFERDRWKGEAAIDVSADVARNGKRSLKTEFTTKKYSWITLFHFPSNWQGFASLHVSIYFPEKEQLTLVCRINDREHNNNYADRFNKRFVLQKGWNDLVISLDEVRQAPDGRVMNMEQIDEVSFFVIEQKKERVVYLDWMYLDK